MGVPACGPVMGTVLHEFAHSFTLVEEAPEEELEWDKDHASGILKSLQEIADLIPHTDGHILIVCPRRPGWYTQCLCRGSRWQTECATWESATNTVHNYRIGYADKSDLKFADAYSVMAGFCRHRTWADTYATLYTQY